MWGKTIGNSLYAWESTAVNISLCLLFVYSSSFSIVEEFNAILLSSAETEEF